MDIILNQRTEEEARAFIESRYPYLVGNVKYFPLMDEDFIDGEYLKYVSGYRVELQ